MFVFFFFFTFSCVLLFLFSHFQSLFSLFPPFSPKWGMETSLDMIAANEYVLTYVYRALKTAIAAIDYDKQHTSVEKRYLKVRVCVCV